jgi:hypothetical protein
MIGRIAMSLLGGSSVGAALMYLFDPELGPKHRKQIRRTAHGAYDATVQGYDTAVESAGPAWETFKERAGEKAVDWRARLSDRLADASRMVAPDGPRVPHPAVVPADYYQRDMDLSPRQSMTALALARHSRELHGEAREAYMRARDMYYDSLIDLDLARARSRRAAPKPKPVVLAKPKPKASAHGGWSWGARKKQSPDYLTISLVAAGCCALGAAAMFMSDPVAGRRRRALVRDKTYRTVHRTTGAVAGGAFSAANYASGRARGVAARAKSMVSSQADVDDAKLVARIRSEMGRVVSHASSIDVKASGGSVTLSGTAPASEFDALMKCVYAVPGVHEVVNQVQTQAATR